jgi:hypothetical protein
MNLNRSIRATLATLLLAAPALADTVTIDGTITPSDPTMAVVFISSPNCTGQGVTPVLYHSYPFTVTADGTYHLEVLSDAGFASVYIFSPTFDPAAGFPTCIAGDNSGNPVEVDEALTVGTQYFAVPFDDTFDQLGGNYTLTLSGPGTIFVANQESILAIPTLSTLGLATLAALFLVAAFLALRRRSSAA